MVDVNDILKQLKDLLSAPTKGSYFEATKLKKKIEGISVGLDNDEKEKIELSDEDPAPGDLVFLSTINDVAVLDSITNNGEYIVKIGNIKTTARKKNVRKLKDQSYKTKKTPDVKKPIKYVNPVQPMKNVIELNLLGKRVDEAIYILDDFLADCRAHNLESCRIIHGNGTGALRNGIWDYLSGADIVSYRLGNRDEGGTGATVVRLR